MSPLPLLQLLFLTLTFWFSRATAQPSSLSVANNCSEAVFVSAKDLSTTNVSVDPNVQVAPGTTVDMHVSGGWAGYLRFGTGCTSDGSNCTTGGDQWTGITPFSTAFLNYTQPGSALYRIQMAYGFNVGVKIQSTNDPNCPGFSCDGIGKTCSVPGPSGSCYSPCCSSAAACAGGAYPTDSDNGGCPNLDAIPPSSDFYESKCPNAWAGLFGFPSSSYIDATCNNTNMLVTLCPGYSSFYTFPSSSTTATSSGSSIVPSTSSTSSASSPPAPFTISTPGKRTSHTAVIAGATVGGLATCALAGLVGILFLRRARRQRNPTDGSPEMQEGRIEPLVVDGPPQSASGNQNTAVLEAGIHNPSGGGGYPTMTVAQTALEGGATKIGQSFTSQVRPHEKRRASRAATFESTMERGGDSGPSIAVGTTLPLQAHQGNEVGVAHPLDNSPRTSFNASEAPPEYED